MSERAGTGTMKRWLVTGTGRSNLALSSAAIPMPAANEILVRVAAVSLNFRDLLLVEQGLGFAGEPLVPASDAAGVVIAAGKDVTRFKAGDRVISTFIPGWINGRDFGNARAPSNRTLGGPLPGVLSEYVAWNEEWAVKVPEALNDVEASTLPCAGLTAWNALVELGHLQAGQTVVVQGTGGVALFGVQIAAAHGAEAIVISGDNDKLERAKALGARHGINRKREDWVEAVYRLTHDRGADHILEIVGGAHLGRSLQAAAVGGRVSLIGVHGGVDLAGHFVPLALKQVVVQGIHVGHRDALDDLVRAVDRTALKPVIDTTLAFADLPAALDRLKQGPFGKVVVRLGA